MEVVIFQDAISSQKKVGNLTVSELLNVPDSCEYQFQIIFVISDSDDNFLMACFRRQNQETEMK